MTFHDKMLSNICILLASNCVHKATQHNEAATESGELVQIGAQHATRPIQAQVSSQQIKIEITEAEDTFTESKEENLKKGKELKGKLGLRLRLRPLLVSTDYGRNRHNVSSA